MFSIDPQSHSELLSATMDETSFIQRLESLEPKISWGGRYFHIPKRPEDWGTGEGKSFDKELSITEITNVANKWIKDHTNLDDSASKQSRCNVAKTIAKLDFKGDLELQKAGRWQRLLHFFKGFFTQDHTNRLITTFGVTKDEIEQAKNNWAGTDVSTLRYLALQGNKYAQFKLGDRLESDLKIEIQGKETKGAGYDVRKKEIFKWKLKAANQGHYEAMVNVASYYENGYGVKKNEKESQKWNKKADDPDRAFSLKKSDSLSKKYLA